jgi:release factor glutamine methyltransferase
LAEEKKILRRMVFWLLYNAYVKRRISKIDNTSILGFSLSVPPTVFHPKLYHSSKYFGSFLIEMDLKNKNILEIGCGSGILSLVVASKGANVVAVDINPEAVRATADNAKRNRLCDNIRAIESDLFGKVAVDTRFDLVIMNPPYYAGRPDTISDYAWRAGEKYEFFDRFAEHVGDFLASNGSILMILSSDSDISRIENSFTAKKYKMTELRSKKLLFETLKIFQVERNK